MKTKTAPSARELRQAMAYATKLLNKDFGPVSVVRAVTQNHPRLRRRDVLQIATALDINHFTASRQFQEIRSGTTQVVF